MSVIIGDNNKINNTIISDKSYVEKNLKNKSFLQNHKILCGVVAAVIAGFILTFSFWDKIRIFIEGLF